MNKVHSHFKRITVCLLAMILLCYSVSVIYAEDDASHPLCLPASKHTSVDYTVNPDFSWSYSSTYSDASHNAYIAGNSGTAVANVSNLAITVAGTGSISFDYYMDSYAATKVLFLFYSFNTPLTNDNWSSTALNKAQYTKFYGVQPWTHVEVPVDESVLVNGSATLYIAYCKTTADTNGKNIAAIANLSFDNGKKVLNLEAYDANAGTVQVQVGGSVTDLSITNQFVAGATVEVTATPNTGYRFYGWAVDGSYVGTDTSYTFQLNADTTLTPLLAQEDAYGAIRVGTGETECYAQSATVLADALSDSSSGDIVVILDDLTISQNLTIPTGVTLYVPYCEEYDADGNADGTTANSIVFATASETYCCVTIAEGKTLTVNGILRIGGVIGYPSQYYQGHTSGAHGRITNNGTIAVNDGSIECYGFIDGTGTVEAVSGTVTEPFVVFDFAGGSNLEQLARNQHQNGFVQYTMQNISCTLIIHDTASLSGYCNLYALSDFQKTDSPVAFIGGQSTAPDSLVVLESGATATRAIDKTKSIGGGTIIGYDAYGADIGRVDYTISGGAKLNKMGLVVWGFTVSVDHFPIPYCYSYELTNGTYTMPYGWDIMPGAELTVAKTANLMLDGRLYVLDGYKAGDMSGRSYPSSEKLAENGFSTCGVFIVDGVFNLGASATFGGIVQTNGTGKITSHPGVTVSNPQVQIGATAYYDDNTCIMPLDGRIMVGDTLITLVPGTVYNADSGEAWVLDGYTLIEYATDQVVLTEPTTGKYGSVSDGAKTRTEYVIHAENETVTTNQIMKGTFIAGGKMASYLLVNKTKYDASDSTRTTISEPVYGVSDATFTVSRTSLGSAYNFVVQYNIDGGENIYIKADANGLYSVPKLNGIVTITVTSVKRGDVDLDGNITAADVTKVRRSLAKYQVITDELSLSAADCDKDGNVTAADVTKLRRFFAKYITAL